MNIPLRSNPWREFYFSRFGVVRHLRHGGRAKRGRQRTLCLDNINDWTWWGGGGGFHELLRTSENDVKWRNLSTQSSMASLWRPSPRDWKAEDDHMLLLFHFEISIDVKITWKQQHHTIDNDNNNKLTNVIDLFKIYLYIKVNSGGVQWHSLISQRIPPIRFGVTVLPWRAISHHLLKERCLLFAKSQGD